MEGRLFRLESRLGSSLLASAGYSRLWSAGAKRAIGFVTVGYLPPNASPPNCALPISRSLSPLGICSISVLNGYAAVVSPNFQIRWGNKNGALGPSVATMNPVRRSGLNTLLEQRFALLSSSLARNAATWLRTRPGLLLVLPLLIRRCTTALGP